MKFKRLECIGEGTTGLNATFFHDGWKITQTTSPEKIYDGGVPGNVRLSLMEAGVISDPFIKKNNEDSKWVSLVEWDYTNQIPITKLSPENIPFSKEGGIFHTVFDAIDYDASFTFNEEEITRQTGMFSAVDIACAILPEEKIAEKDIPIKLHFYEQPFWRQNALKSQMAFEWDFAPDIRTIGIWKDVRTYYTGSAFFSEAFVMATPSDNSKTQPSIIAENQKNIVFSGKVSILNLKSMELITNESTIEFDIVIGEFKKKIPIKISSGESFELDMGPVDIPLWEPWSVGEPNVVPITIKLMYNGEISDEYRGTVVNRHVEWVRNPGTFPGDENWTMVVNGKKLFLRGINWVPPDSLYGRLGIERYKKLVDMAKEMKIDILRVWGGGIEEKPEFYDYCDQVGMMVWQEFPFACTNYPKDPKYVKIADEECRGIARRTRRHPSVVVYCGGNEFNPFINSHIIDIVKNAVRDYAPDRYCFAASPYLGDDHNWKVWGFRRRFEGYEMDGNGPFQMLTEYGMQASPDYETLKSCYEGDETALIETIKEDLTYHKADMNGHLKYAELYSEKISTQPEFVKVTQTLQAYALKYAIEVCRSSWPNVTGVFPWQLSDPWPNISWSVVDYYFRPKLAYKMLKISYSAILPMVRKWKKVKGDDRSIADIIVHNSTQDLFEGRLDVEIMRKSPQNSQTLYSNSIDIKVSPDRPLKVGTVKAQPLKGTVIYLKLYDKQDKLLVKNFNFPAMEPQRAFHRRYMDTFDARFDSWWRANMTNLMELDKIREEVPNYERKKKTIQEAKANL